MVRPGSLIFEIFQDISLSSGYHTWSKQVMVLTTAVLQPSVRKGAITHDSQPLLIRYMDLKVKSDELRVRI